MKRTNPATVLLAAILCCGLAGCAASPPRQQSVEQAIDDGVVTARIKAALVEDPVTKPHQIEVETFKGEVQLSGFVETDEARTRALNLARQVSGVKQVTDAMQIRTSEPTG